MTRSLSLRLLSGADQGRTVEIPRAGLLIGRRAGNDLVLDDPSVSGRHALVRPEGGKVWVEDLGSTNGTQVDGERVERAELEPGCRVACGKVELLVVAGAAAAEPAAAPDAPQAMATLDVDELSLEDAPLALEDSETLLDVPVERAPVDLPARSLAEEFEEPALDQVEALRPRRSAAAAGGSAAARSGGRAASAAAPVAPAAPEVDDAGVAEVDAAILARAQKKSRGPLIGLAGLVVAAAAAGAYVLQGDDEAGSGQARAVTPLATPGNRLALAVASFESAEADGWSTPERSPLRFGTSRADAFSGALGLGLEPAAGQWAELRSAPVTVAPGAELAASVRAAGTGPAALRLGLRLEANDGSAAPIVLWSERAAGEFEELELRAAARVPSGYDVASVVLMAGDAEGRSTADADEPPPAELGRVSFDDAALTVASGEPLAAFAVGDFELVLAPGAAGQALLTRTGRPLLGLRSGAAFPLAPAGGLTAERAAPGDALDAEGRLELRVQGGQLELELFDLLLGSQTRIAAIADGEHRELPARFELGGVEELILGGGLDLIALRFDPPAELEAEPLGATVRVAVRGVSGVQLRLAFDEARKQATILSAAAERADQESRLGDVIRVWSELLESVPYDPALVARGSARIGELSNLAETDLREAREALVRADFFRLPAMYEEVVEQARAIEALFLSGEPVEGSDRQRIAAEVAALVTEAQQRLAGLDGPAAALREAQREAVYGLLEQRGAVGLVQDLERSGGSR